jgi:hypothetical protein
MAGLKAQAAVPGPSPLQEQLFFGLLILLMLVCLLRSGCVRARVRARVEAKRACTGPRGAEARVRGAGLCRSKDSTSGSNKKVRYSSRSRSQPAPAPRLALVERVAALQSAYATPGGLLPQMDDGTGSSDDEDGDVVSDKSD